MTDEQLEKFLTACKRCEAVGKTAQLLKQALEEKIAANKKLCPHCARMILPQFYTSHHGDNCKKKVSTDEK